MCEDYGVFGGVKVQQGQHTSTSVLDRKIIRVQDPETMRDPKKKRRHKTLDPIVIIRDETIPGGVKGSISTEPSAGK